MHTNMTVHGARRITSRIKHFPTTTWRSEPAVEFWTTTITITDEAGETHELTIQSLDGPLPIDTLPAVEVS